MNIKKSKPGIRSEIPVSRDKDHGNKDYAGFLFVAVMLFAIAGSAYYLLKNFNTHSLFERVESINRLLDELPSLDSFQKKIPFKPRQNAPKEILQDRQLVSQGYDLYMQNNFEQAVQRFNQAISINPNNPEAYYWRGRTLTRMDKNDEALDDFLKALANKPDYSEACDNLGWLYMRRGELDKSILYLSKAIDLKPDNAWAYYNRAYVHAKKKEMGKAIADAEKACQLGFEKGCQMVEKNRKTVKKGE